MKQLDKVVRIGTGEHGDVFCRVQISGNGNAGKKRQIKLSITGVEGPLRDGNARGGCGQIVDRLNGIKNFAPMWFADKRDKFADYWRKWHLNDMRAGCEHQRAEKWNERPIDPTKPTNAYGKFFPGQSCDSWNMLAWVRQDEHPEGLLSRPCPVCGYKYGSAWLYEELPADVIEFMESLPDADRQPAWV